MGFFKKLFGQESKQAQLSSKDVSLVLASLCSDLNDRFFHTIVSECESNGIRLEANEISCAKYEIVLINLWLIGFTLSGDRKAEKAIQFLFNDFATSMSAHIEDQRERAELHNLHGSKLFERYREYCQIWDEKSGGSQTILANKMIQNLFNESRLDDCFKYGFLFYHINLHILNGMLAITKSFGLYEITD